MAEQRDVYTYFWIEGFPQSCEELTAQIGLKPTEVRHAGEVLPSGDVARRNSWRIVSPLARGECLIQESLEALLPLLESRGDLVRSLAAEYSAGINCVGYYYGSNPGLHLSANLIQRLSNLRLSVDFDLYNYTEEHAR